MFTFIELQGFSKRRQLLLPDDEFRIFQELLIQDPLPVTLSQAQAVLEKFAGTVLEWGNGVAFG
ncbi:toxin RelE [Escherichia coli]|uniref:Toxin RelE n=1 Tax=Escherichia coli TaxID=562 RepID=A0A377BWA8_ECOLX|nr:toxin RelE [Escherichia coli]